MRFFCLFSRLRALPKNTRRKPSAYALRHFPPSFFQKKFQKPRSRCRSSTHLTPRFRTDIFLSPAQRRFAARRQTDFRARLQFPQSSDGLPRAAVRHVIARTVRFRRAHAHVRLHNDKVTLRYLCQRQQLLTNAKAAICPV